MASSSSTTVANQLLGPPEIYQTKPVKLLGPPEIHQTHNDNPAVNSSSSSKSSPFIDLMVDNFNKTSIIGEDVYGSDGDNDDFGFRARTENGSATFNSTGNHLLDFFFHIVPDTPPESLTQRLELAWKHDPLKALKLICHLRGVRGTGKSDKEGFYAAALWLHQNHPKTLACNLKSLAKFGYFKDLPEILYRLLEGLEVRKIAKMERPRKNKRRNKSKRSFGLEKRANPSFVRSRIPREERILAEEKRVEIEKEKARRFRKEKVIAKARKATERYNRDPDYRFLHDGISNLFAECLASDLEYLNSGEPCKICLASDLEYLNSGEPCKVSLASKWCPSVDYSFDQSTLICESIARRMFPRDSNPEYVNIEEAHYAYRVRDRLRKEVLVPLRKALELPEIYMGAKRWESLPYNRVASVAMKNYTKIFTKHDEERFKEYLESVKRGEKKIAAGALLPHQIIASLDDDEPCDVAELQWQRMVEDLSKTGKLKDCLAICDVSGSMGGTPIYVCVALGLLVSDLSEDPWKGKVITFSSDPQLHKIEGDNLMSKTKFVKRMDWGMSTNFQKVFDLILKVAVKGNLKEDQMIKRLFVFSDMEFDEASENDWETDYQAIERKFRKEGYTSVPQIVFWNLRDSTATPVLSKQKGVALVSGFSKNLLHLFLEDGDLNDLEPVAVMEKAISGKAYNDLVVVD